jgi:hypothetical protein
VGWLVVSESGRLRLFLLPRPPKFRPPPPLLHPPSPPPGARATLNAACSPDAWRLSAATGGFFNADTRPVLLAPALQGDDAVAGWLWGWSAERVGLPDKWDLPAAA